MMLKVISNPIPDEQLEKRKELERKLEADIKELEMLQFAVDTTRNATARFDSILSSFDSRLSKLEAYIMPIHLSTLELTRKNNNLETAIGLVNEYMNVVGAINWHETVVEKGVARTSLEAYLESVNKLKESLHLLEASKYKSSERITQDLRGRLSKGIQELDDLFQKTILSSIENISPSDLADGRISFGDKLIQLNTLASVLSESLEQIGPITGFQKIYSTTRAQFLVNALSQHNAAAKDQEVKMGYTREVFHRGSSLLIPYAKYMIVLLQAEYSAVSEVIPKAHVNATFVNTVTPVVDNFLETAEALLTRVRRSIQRRELNDLYVLIDVWESLASIIYEQDALLAQCGKKGLDLKTFLMNAGGAVLGYYKEFYEELKNDSDAKKQLPLAQDGTVNEVTSNTISCMKKIFEFSSAIQSMIEEHKNGHLGFPATSTKDYINKLLETLMEDIDGKAKSYKKPILTILFSLNNIHYVLKSVKGTQLGEVVKSSVIESIETGLKKNLDSYRNSWIPIIEHLMDSTKIADGGKIVTQLSKAQREAIKEKFKNFNRDFEEAFTTQKGYSIPDVELRAQVIKEVRQILCPMFNRFYDKYTTSLEFTKNIDKYVKFNKEELSDQLDKLFDATQ